MANDINWQDYKDQIQKLSSLEYNYDDKMYHDSKDKIGWFVDHYEATLAVEPPGLPIKNGPFEVTQDAIKLYRFPNPKLIHAIFDPEQELSGRNMLMFARFAGFTFTFGVRVTAVNDEVRKNTQGDEIKFWGYSYRTLKGHFEIGEIRFEVNKNLKTGEIGFMIDAYSKPDHIPNIFYRVGFKLFGRILQKYFASSSIQRLQRISQTALIQNIK
ncbi:MAG: DUF1990 domain-containing protein [Bdellovibrionaceae bacterium]|nr:DUF1990 domain-containing protein [Pseudobdellovibrionaceae bacterium]